MSKPYKLYYAPDNASLVVRLALEEMGVVYETVLVDRARQEQRGDIYRKLNPNGLIPVLVCDDTPIFETAAILLWLVDCHEQLGPAPASSERAAFLKWLFFLSNTIHPLMRQRFYPEVYVGDKAEARDGLRSRATQSLLQKLQFLEDECEKAKIIGHRKPTVLDFYIACALRWSRLYPKDAPEQDHFDLQRFPALHAMLEQLEKRPSVIAAVQAEGLGDHPFTRPVYPDPPEGSAL